MPARLHDPTPSAPQGIYGTLQKFRELTTALAALCGLLSVGFLAVGFDFRTPKAWMMQTQDEVALISARVDSLEARSVINASMLRLTVRISCASLTTDQAAMVPECDPFRSLMRSNAAAARSRADR